MHWRLFLSFYSAPADNEECLWHSELAWLISAISRRQPTMRNAFGIPSWLGLFLPFPGASRQLGMPLAFRVGLACFCHFPAPADNEECLWHSELAWLIILFCLIFFHKAHDDRRTLRAACISLWIKECSLILSGDDSISHGPAHCFFCKCIYL